MKELIINTPTLNPDIFYVYDCITTTARIGQNHAHDFIEISIILDGSVEYTIEGVTQEVHKGDVLLFNSGVHHYDTSTHDVHNRQLHIGFHSVIFEGYPRDTFPIQSPILTLKKYAEEFYETCHEIIAENEARNCGYDTILKALTIKLIVLITRELNTKPSINEDLLLTFEERGKQDIANVIMSYMQEHYMEDISLSKISKSMYISPAYVSKIFKDETGDSPINYLIKIRLSHANDLLKRGRMSVKEVAKHVGYDDAYYFSKLFKKYYGYPPSKTLQHQST